MKLSHVAVLAGFILACAAAGAFGSLFSAPAIGEWYASLAKPPWTPPGWLFGPVWTALYLSMGVAGWLAWRRSASPTPTILFAAQLALNAAWSPLFFGLRSPAAAAIEIVVLWYAILATAIAFFRVSRPAGFLFVPYLLWVGFAAVLNFSIWWLNA